MGDGRFEEVTQAAGLGGEVDSFCAAWGDYDNDGWLDLYVANGVSQQGWPNALYRNNGDDTFADRTERAGLTRSFGTMAAIYGDVDSDGYQDIYLGNGGPDMDRFEPDRLFLNNGDGTFADITDFAGVGNLGKGHGTTMIDFDDDGDLDIYSPQGGMGGNPGDTQPNSLYRNEGHNNHWLKIKLIGAAATDKKLPYSNRDGIGAQVRAKRGTELRLDQVSGGGGFGVTNSL
jgi:hypothetical protein